MTGRGPDRPGRTGNGIEKKGGYPSGQPAAPKPPKPPSSGGPGGPSKPSSARGN